MPGQEAEEFRAGSGDGVPCQQARLAQGTPGTHYRTAAMVKANAGKHAGHGCSGTCPWQEGGQNVTLLGPRPLKAQPYSLPRTVAQGVLRDTLALWRGGESPANSESHWIQGTFYLKMDKDSSKNWDMRKTQCSILPHPHHLFLLVMTASSSWSGLGHRLFISHFFLKLCLFI